MPRNYPKLASTPPNTLELTESQLVGAAQQLLKEESRFRTGGAPKVAVCSLEALRTPGQALKRKGSEDAEETVIPVTPLQKARKSREDA